MSRSPGTRAKDKLPGALGEPFCIVTAGMLACSCGRMAHWRPLLCDDASFSISACIIGLGIGSRLQLFPFPSFFLRMVFGCITMLSRAGVGVLCVHYIIRLTTGHGEAALEICFRDGHGVQIGIFQINLDCARNRISGPISVASNVDSKSSVAAVSSAGACHETNGHLQSRRASPLQVVGLQLNDSLSMNFVL